MLTLVLLSALFGVSIFAAIPYGVAKKLRSRAAIPAASLPPAANERDLQDINTLMQSVVTLKAELAAARARNPAAVHDIPSHVQEMILASAYNLTHVLTWLRQSNQDPPVWAELDPDTARRLIRSEKLADVVLGLSVANATLYAMLRIANKDLPPPSNGCE